MNNLRTAAQQALDRLQLYHHGTGFSEDAECIAALRAALAQPEPVIDRAMAVRIATQLGWVPPQPEHKSHCALLQIPSRECDCGEEPALSRCPQCGGPADNGHDRSIPPSPYWCTKCMAEPVQEPVAWYLPSPDGDDSIFRDHRTVIACTGNKWEGFQPLYTAPPRCPNCTSLEEQNTELDRKLVEMERKPLSLTDLQEALVLTNLIDRDAIDNSEEYDERSTLAQIDELYRIIKE